MDWYNAIRAAKLERKKVAFPDREESDVSMIVDLRGKDYISLWQDQFQCLYMYFTYMSKGNL